MFFRLAIFLLMSEQDAFFSYFGNTVVDCAIVIPAEKPYEIIKQHFSSNVSPLRIFCVWSILYFIPRSLF